MLYCLLVPLGKATLLNSALLGALACGKTDGTVVDIGAGEKQGV